MKEYTTLEMIELLSENAGDKYISNNAPTLIASRFGGAIKLEYCSGAPANLIGLSRTWKKLKKPIAFMEVVKAKDTDVILSYPGLEIAWPTPLSKILEFMIENYHSEEIRDIILNGEWYVE